MKKIIKSILMVAIISQMSFAVENKIKIDIISDVVCPWCAVGYKRLSTAIKELNIEDKVEIVWHPFQLNPDMPREGTNADKYLMNKYKLSEKELVAKRKSVTKTGEESGFKFNYFKKMKKVNTFNAHVLLDYAKEFNKQTELKVRLQEAYFGEQKDVSDRNILAAELQAVGLNVDEAMKRLDNQEAIERVQNEEKYWRDRGVFAIPTMFFNNSDKLVGAYSVEMYKEELMDLLNMK